VKAIEFREPFYYRWSSEQQKYLLTPCPWCGMSPFDRPMDAPPCQTCKEKNRDGK
jgi:hypothetical protein